VTPPTFLFLFLFFIDFIFFQFVSSMNPAADVLALASAEFDTDNIAMGTTITVKWRGKPIFIRRRTEAEIAKEVAVDISGLRDPQTDQARAADPEW
jgi:ubiquinol-cytochrome c reductase iron-sulfur subunit